MKTGAVLGHVAIRFALFDMGIADPKMSAPSSHELDSWFGFCDAFFPLPECSLHRGGQIALPLFVFSLDSLPRDLKLTIRDSLFPMC